MEENKVDRKALTNNKNVVELEPKIGANMIYQLSQNIGEPCTPLVKVGDRVLVGQKIGESDKFISSPIHSSVSGIVKEIRQTPAVPTPKGDILEAIIVENDGKFEEYPNIGKGIDYKKSSKDEIISVIKEAGIVGLGGAGFPTHVKLNPPADVVIDHILVNGIECEPYLTNDHRLLLEKADELVMGLEIILSLHTNVKGIIAIAEDKMDAVELLQEKTKNIENIEIMHLPSSLSQGAEKMLIRSCLDRKVPMKGLPSEVGCIVINVATVISIHEAVVNGKPHIKKNVTVSGDLVNNPQNVHAYIGMTYGDLVDACGGLKEQPFKMISGGPKMGFPFTELGIPVSKATSGILCFSQELAEAPLK